MTADTPDLTTLTARLEALGDRLHNLEVQVRGLVTSQTVEAKEFVVKDERGQVRARLEVHQYAPSLTFYDSSGKERLKIGLHTDGTPAMWADGREIPFLAPRDQG
jgi:hypothetical protein